MADLKDIKGPAFLQEIVLKEVKAPHPDYPRTEYAYLKDGTLRRKADGTPWRKTGQKKGKPKDSTPEDLTKLPPGSYSLKKIHRMLIQIMVRDVHHLKASVLAGALRKDESLALVNYLKLVKDLAKDKTAKEIKEAEIDLHKLTDAQLEALAKSAGETK